MQYLTPSGDSKNCPTHRYVLCNAADRLWPGMGSSNTFGNASDILQLLLDVVDDGRHVLPTFVDFRRRKDLKPNAGKRWLKSCTCAIFDEPSTI